MTKGSVSEVRAHYPCWASYNLPLVCDMGITAFWRGCPIYRYLMHHGV